MSSSPATTCAFVTTTPSRATQPDPSTPSPHAVPSTFATLRPAALTCGSRAMRELGGATFASGPLMCGKGSKRASAFRIAPDGGSVLLRARRIVERWMSRRSPRAPGVWSATDPAIHAIPSPIAATSAAPPRPSISPKLGGSRPRRRKPTTSSPEAKAPPIRSAPIRPKSGAYGECDPSWSRSGPSRAPRNAPAANPASDSAPTIAPCAYPQAAISSAKATMIQSIAVIGGRDVT